LISFILLDNGFKYSFQYFVDLVGEGYSLEETFLIGPWFSWFVLVRQGTTVTHDFGHHDDVLMMVYSGSSLELSPEKSYLHLFPEITFLRTVRRLLVYLPARMHDSRRLP
jgi:hypothetical protein